MRYALPDQGTADLPALDRALSGVSMLDAFRRYLPPRDGTDWTRCDVERVSYRPGKSARVLYRLVKEGDTQAGAPHYFYCEFLPAKRSLRRYMDLEKRSGAVRPSGFVAELDMLLWRFPADPRLVQLEGVWREGSWKVVTYTPTMSCVLAGEYGGEATIVKLYHDDRVERVASVMHALGSAGVPVPRVLGVDAARRLLVLEHVPGVGFWSAPQAHLDRSVMVVMARTIAALHDTQLAGPTRDTLEHVQHGEREWHRFADAAADLANAFPDLEPRLERLTKMLGRVPTAPPPALLHGDFHPAQFLVDGGTARLIDFDNVCLGDPMYDLARFASHLYYKGQLHGRPVPEIERAVSSFRAAYIAAGSHFVPGRWFWHLAVSLVAKRAHRVMTRLETGAGPIVRHLVTIAEQNAASIVHT